MDTSLYGKKILVLVANGVGEAAMSTVQRELLKCGAEIKTAGLEPGLVNSWNGTGWGLYFPVDQPISTTLGSDFDCLVVPAGERGIQKLATSPHCARIVTSFLNAGKQVVFMGNALGLLEKIGLAGSENKETVMTGEDTDIPAFVESMIAHFTDVPETKAAA